MLVVAIALVTALVTAPVSITTASPAFVDGDEKATRQELHKDEQDRSDEGNSPA
jgi:hypothetical protein